MTLQDLIERRDIEVAVKKQHDMALIEQAGEFLYQASYAGRRNFNRNQDPYYKTHGLVMEPFNWLGMNMWPNVKEDKMRTTYMITLSQHQMNALLLSTFEGHMQGGVRRYGLMYWWQFQPREDGWVELIVWTT